MHWLNTVRLTSGQHRSETAAGRAEYCGLNHRLHRSDHLSHLLNLTTRDEYGKRRKKMRACIDQRAQQIPLTQVALQLLPQQIRVKTDAVTAAIQISQ